MGRVFISLLLSTAVFTGACSTAEVDENDPKSVYDDAQTDIEAERFLIALDKLRMVKNKFPYSSYSVRAELRIADVYYLQESYLESAAAYTAFKDLHPSHKKIEYAMFRVGESYQKAIPGKIARDITGARRAVRSFEEFLYRFPKGKLSKDAKKKIGEVREVMASKEKYIADFYLRDDQYLSAIGRYEDLIKVYPDTEAAKDSADDLADAREEYKEELKEKEAEEKEQKKEG